MPRQPRRKSYTNVYHCMLRGINKQDIFLDQEDYFMFLNIIQKTKTIFSYLLYAYVLMPNHIHLEIKCDYQELSQVMHRIQVSYAMFFNKKYDRIGHLFQNRFQSKVVENQTYLLNLTRYIHQNPEKARLCKFENYQWSSYKDYTQEKEKNIKITDITDVLILFSADQNENRKALIQFHKIGLKENWQDLLEYEMKHCLSDEKIIYFIKEELGIENVYEIQNYAKQDRNKTIRKIKEKKGCSCIQLSRILGINRRIIERA